METAWRTATNSAPVEAAHRERIRERFGLTTLVETGTYYGEMIAAVGSQFQRIYSIELDPRLADMAKTAFAVNLKSRSSKATARLWCRNFCSGSTNAACFGWMQAIAAGWEGWVIRTG